MTKSRKVSGISIHCVPPDNVDEACEPSILAHAKCAATIDEEHAVSIAMLGPFIPKVNDGLLARNEIPLTCTCVRIERPFCRSQNELVVIPHYANKYPHMMIYFRVRYTMQAFDATIQQMTLLRVHAYRFLRCQVEYSVVKVKDVAQQHSKSRRSTEKLNVKTSRKPSLQFSTSDQ
jgi:hypothetical protein